MAIGTRREFGRLIDAWIAASCVRAILAAWIPCPQIVTDEVRFMGLANDIAHGDWRGPFSTFHGYPFAMYSALLAPLVGFFPAHAYLACKILNAFLISSVCLPTWLLARRMLPRRWAFGGALLSLCLPALGYASNLMAENLFYPLILWTLEIALRWRETGRPRWGAVLAVTGGALVLTKAQGVLVLAGICLLPLLPAFGGAWRRRAIWVARYAASAFVAGTIFVAAGWLRWGPELPGRAFDPSTWLGYYAMYLHPPGPRQLRAELSDWVAYLFASGAENAPLVGLCALVAAADAALHGRRRATRLLAPLTLVLWFAFARDGVRLAVYFDGPKFIYERYTAALAAVLVLLLAERAWRRRRWLAPAIIGSAVFGLPLALLWIPKFASNHLIADAPGLSWLMLVVPHIGGWVAGAGLATAAALLASRRSPTALACTIAAVMTLTGLGMTVSERQLVGEDMGLHMALVPLAQRLAVSHRFFVLLSDDIDIHDVWNAEMFSNEGEGKAFCTRPSQNMCLPTRQTTDGRLPDLEALPPGTALVTGETLQLPAKAFDAEGPYRAYLIDGPVQRYQ